MKHNTKYKIKVSDPLLRPGMQIEAGPVSEDYVAPTAKKLMGFVREINETDEEFELDEDYLPEGDESFEDVMDTIENSQSEAEYTNETVSFDQWLSEVNRIAEEVYEWKIDFDKTERWKEVYEDGVPAGKAITKVLKEDASI